MSLREEWVTARTRAAEPRTGTVFIGTNGRGPRPGLGPDPDRDLRAAVVIVRRLITQLRETQRAVDVIQTAETMAEAQERAQAISVVIEDVLADFFDDE